MGTGHFTQVVWRGTTHIGIGAATTSSGSRVYVFHYKPAGNVIGHFPANVQPPQQRPPVKLRGGDVLKPGQELLSSRDDAITSRNGRYRLVQQSDSHLVLYGNGKAIWANQQWGAGVVKTVMQEDGNLVSYTASGEPKWASGTYGRPGAYLIVQDDGNLVIYQGSQPVWASNTVGQ
ncbi:hypothetical protein HYH03_006886 [Edaphochlamys debaryana]|uniref:Bulb-type lectin domain-containing protein n=1 Tax=Edaphochlamys debaryana TaxID=47281 RepID=A0A836C0X8_9CHLO|nr:hypothetical protein HYH03_006884 [Edaphochlamys debaryana]KAG2494951.1 hypothetical protein HYH03_006886 [Edaphochlamys debaryana]|eukprot:KAG2494949.1 hypothetical protein HYH03_006884 [Edaphochlamys debaryana]